MQNTICVRVNLVCYKTFLLYDQHVNPQIKDLAQNFLKVAKGPSTPLFSGMDCNVRDTSEEYGRSGDGGGLYTDFQGIQNLQQEEGRVKSLLHE